MEDADLITVYSLHEKDLDLMNQQEVSIIV